METPFKDRQDAGIKLAKALSAYEKVDNTLVIALPRGGVVVGAEIAKKLHLPLDICCPRKIGAPFNPEYAIGAVTETGEKILSESAIKQLGISESYVREAVEKERQEAQHRLSRYRKNRPPRQLAGKRVILVDDGLATGSTMSAALKTAKAEKAAELIIAIPVAPQDTLQRLEKEEAHIVCLLVPSHFFAVGQFYERFDQTTDEEVIRLLELLKPLD